MSLIGRVLFIRNDVTMKYEGDSRDPDRGEGIAEICNGQVARDVSEREPAFEAP